ncbi:TIGR03088 family PEP-CTERM/XrtA system glycosyltransferase [Caenispirillum salinarum]|uniref:TIGR03088 family PEP-CTERM/XrtA system glycosyltransferase n=1 Tax=Caenispirillum salinarum TaxID=859058 RepID=UPI00384C0182
MTDPAAAYPADRAQRPAPGSDAGVPLVVHVVDRLGVGGMENGLVNIINGTDPARVRHAVVCLRAAGAFQARLTRGDVPVIVLGKKDGKDPAAYLRLWSLLRRLRPDVVHTRNLPAVDMVVPGRLCGASVVIHGEHGRDAVEEDGANRRYNRLRRAVSPLVDGYVAVSRDIQRWMTGTVGLPAAKVRHICNGVDSRRFRPLSEAGAGTRGPLPAPEGFAGPDQVVFGTVGRMQTVKDQVTLARAFCRAVDAMPDGRRRLRLALIGDGPLLAECRAVLAEAGVSDLAWMPGARDDVPALLQGLDVFVLPSRTEGICNTILEAMASGLPVLATDVGGNPELVTSGETGLLVPPSDPEALAGAMIRHAGDAALRRRQGAAGRAQVLERFALDVMVEAYLRTYETLLAARRRSRRGGRSAVPAAGEAGTP